MVFRSEIFFCSNPDLFRGDFRYVSTYLNRSGFEHKNITLLKTVIFELTCRGLSVPITCGGKKKTDGEITSGCFQFTGEI